MTKPTNIVFRIVGNKGDFKRVFNDISLSDEHEDPEERTVHTESFARAKKPPRRLGVEG